MIYFFIYAPPSRYDRKREGPPCMEKGINGTWLMLFDKILLVLKILSLLRIAIKDLSQADAKDIKNLGIRQECL